MLDIIYLFGSVTFVIGLKMLSHPETARRGNILASIGMTVAIIGTLFLYNHTDGKTTRDGMKIALILGAIAIGTVS